MTIKIDAPKVYAPDDLASAWKRKESSIEKPWRLVRESDWRRIMAVLRAAEDELLDGQGLTHNAVVALRKHLEKRK